MLEYQKYGISSNKFEEFNKKYSLINSHQFKTINNFFYVSIYI